MVFTVKSSNFIFENFYGKILWKQVIGMVRKVGIWEEFMEDVASSPSLLPLSYFISHQLWVHPVPDSNRPDRSYRELCKDP